MAFRTTKMSRKDMRAKNKLQKLKAFVNLTRMVEDDIPSRSLQACPGSEDIGEADTKPNGQVSTIGELQALIKNHYQKLVKPKLHLTDVGERARFRSTGEVAPRPLFAFEVQSLILQVVHEDESLDRPNWFQVVHPGKITHTVVVIVEGASADEYRRNATAVKRCQEIFDMMVEVVPPEDYGSCFNADFFGARPCTSVGSIAEAIDVDETATRLSPNHFSETDTRSADTETAEDVERLSASAEKFSRTSLLLDPRQMANDNYPLENVSSVHREYIFTKDEYGPVTARSPLFAVDCEMCATTRCQSELTRVSVVDEHLDCVYDTLVKPRNEITDYLTRFSGITAEMMEGATARLEDVRRRIRDLLPDDAILCGQSLQNDFHSLKIIHPYVIDTSVIFNLTGYRHKKSSLQLLARTLIGDTIQDKASGHDSIEDATSTMKLVLRKLNEGIEFGDVILNHTLGSNGGLRSKTRSGYGVLRSTNLIEHILDNRRKVAIIRHEDVDRSSYSDCGERCNAGDLVLVPEVASNREVAEQTRQLARDSDFTIAHMKLKLDGREESKYSNLAKRLERIYNSCAQSSLLIAMLHSPTPCSSTGSFQNGLCMIRLK